MALTTIHQPSGFQKLPTELYDEIFSCLREPLISDNPIIGDSVMHAFECIKGIGRDLERYLPRECLNLRLVSKAFNHAIARVWFRTEFLKLRAFDYIGKSRDERPSSFDNINEFMIQGKLIPQALRRLRIDLRGGGRRWFEPNYAESDPADRESLLAFLQLLPAALEKSKRLECLWIDLYEYWACVYGGLDDISAPRLDLAAVNQLRSSLGLLFSPSYAHKFSLLTELRLALPCTYDFAALDKAMSDEATRRLRHLYLEYVDATGPGGDDNYWIWADGQEGVDGDKNFPQSNLQEKHPNYDYMPDICRLVGRCSNLESLGLNATHYLNLDELDWKPSGTGLRNVYICRAVIHFDTLRKLLSAADGESSNLVALNLCFVQLLDCTWDGIFEHLVRVANVIKYFCIQDVDYARRGTSAHLKKFESRPFEERPPIWTLNQADWDRLQDLVGKVLGNGGLVCRELESVAYQAGFDTSDPHSLRLSVPGRRL